MQIVILGRQTKLCQAELESQIGTYELLGENIALVKKNINIDRFGGIIKIAELKIELSEPNLDNFTAEASKLIREKFTNKKLNFGLSWYCTVGFSKSRAVSKIKIKLKSYGVPSRFIKGKSQVLNAAEIIHNKLNITHTEILVVKHNNKLFLGLTDQVQDIQNYSRRDFEKPCRRPNIGMLPPKLSQILINLAMPNKNDIVLDPFCGSGGLIMEALLMGFKSIGSDLSKEMVECSKQNIRWLKKNFSIKTSSTIRIADATKTSYPSKNYVLVTEGYLGKNFHLAPNKQEIINQKKFLEELYINLFKHLLTQFKKPSSIVICRPVWKLGNQTYTLDIIDQIINLGYTKHEFRSARADQLIYHRKGQFTARQILVFKSMKE